MSNPRFRSRVKRLLDGHFRVDDLKTLFLYARDRCDGNEAVREVGDFIAHHDERTKGISTKATRDWFTVARFSSHQMQWVKDPIDYESLPSETVNYLDAAFRRQKSDAFRSKTGLSITAGRRALERLRCRFSSNADESLKLPKKLAPDEELVFKTLIERCGSYYAFDGDNLFNDFKAVLSRNKLLNKDEGNSFEALREPVSLLAISAMHNNEIKMEDGSKIRLRAAKSLYNPVINIFASLPTNVQSDIPLNTSYAIFGGKVEFAARLSPQLMMIYDWQDDVELRDDGMLHAIL